MSDQRSEGPQFRARTKSFVRRQRELSAGLQHTIDREGPRFLVPIQRAEGLTTIAPGFVFDAAKTFGRQAPLVVEVGSGAGEQIVTAAARDPQRNYLSLEVWQAGIAKMISRAAQAEVDNLRVIEVDAALAFPVLFPDHAIAEVWTFFPDPWRKARHRKRRLVSPSFADQVARVLAMGGVWRLATDWDDYAWQMRDVIEATRGLTNVHAGELPDAADPEAGRGGFAPRWDGRVLTRFEQRGTQAGRTIHDLTARRG